MIEFFKGLLEASRDRLKNPILGTYSISFILFNWRPLLFLMFSKASIEDKIIVTNSLYCSWGALLWPLLITIIIAFGVPYFMLLVDIALVKSKKDRRRIRHDEQIISLDEQITIATKEFEIQSRKSGTKTIELLQDSISSLEIEKQTLQESINSERELNSTEVKKLNDVLKNEIEKNNHSKNNPEISFSEKAFETFNYLQNSNKLEEFYNYFDGFALSIKLDEETIKYYKNLGLSRQAEFGSKYTELGFEVYQLIFETNNSKDIKKEMSSLLNKLNNHEIQVLKNLSSNDNLIINFQEGFRKIIISELLDSGFIFRNDKQEYKLTRTGAAFRNLIALNNID
ncbi:hypothetical protein [uncultured Flavobacterium sp.]|uniref:hypothetical protein n=1 Tax=uncultured Flavobacterium sp. TaxID=165435 RepID=UPI0030ED9860|tara:strand:+ start:20738 stop:21760 length:1023 start_codon:yes stop_codon:yes gene_type:complete